MSIHIGAKKGDIAETVLLPGDPMRAKYVAENLLDDAVRYNEVRGMYGYTGFYKGKRVSIQGTGMGMPSASIYINELIKEFGAKQLIRVGSCGALQPELELRDIIIAMATSTTSNIHRRLFTDMHFAPTASWKLLKKAVDFAESADIGVKVGSILSADEFYNDSPDLWKLWASYGVLGVEMEAAALYTLAAKHKVDALAICTVSDSLVNHKEDPSEDRERSYMDMMRIALELA
ncbi:MAG TPA: purine-nucleoside phosphorylase [Trueperaceae bacterium]|nr:purine-nucleoside phosphorylase [Trueperaceae bacterium]